MTLISLSDLYASTPPVFKIQKAPAINTVITLLHTDPSKSTQNSRLIERVEDVPLNH